MHDAITGKTQEKKHKMNQELQRIENFVIYQTEYGKANVEVYFQNDTLWLTQKVMAQLETFA